MSFSMGQGKFADKLIAIGRAVFGVIIFTAFQLFSQYILFFFDFDTTLYRGVFSSISSLIVAVLLVAYVRIIRQDDASYILKGKMIYQQWILVIIISFGLVAMVSLYFILADYIGELSSKVEESIQDYHENIGRPVVEEVKIPAWDHLLYFVSVVILGPFSEELAFRGIVLGELFKKYSPFVAITLSGIIFGAMHMQPVQIGYAVFCGIILGCVYYFCNNFWASFVLHAIFNFLGSGVSTLWESGLFDFLGGEVQEQISSYIYDLETLFLLPAIVSLLFLGLMRHKGIDNLTKIMPVKAVAADAETVITEETSNE